jgi:hypothetical protein
MFKLACLRASTYGSVWASWVQWYFLDLGFGLFGFLVFCRSLCFVLIGEGSVPLVVFSQEVYIFVAWCETLLDVSGFLLTVKNGYNS